MRGGTQSQVEAKRGQLERCDDDLAEARRRLDTAAEHTRTFPADQALDTLQPLSLEIASLRERRDRLVQELDAVEREWAQ